MMRRLIARRDRTALGPCRDGEHDIQRKGGMRRNVRSLIACERTVARISLRDDVVTREAATLDVPLVLTQPDDLLNTGIEMEARPSGKMVRRLSLLSGGERSLCALAYLFSVFRARPSPFYLMDEVEAALDDVNLHRFLDLGGSEGTGNGHG